MLHIKEIELNQLMRISEACLSPVPIQNQKKSCRRCFFLLQFSRKYGFLRQARILVCKGTAREQDSCHRWRCCLYCCNEWSILSKYEVYKVVFLKIIIWPDINDILFLITICIVIIVITHLCLTSQSLIPLTRRRKRPLGIKVRLTTYNNRVRLTTFKVKYITTRPQRINFFYSSGFEHWVMSHKDQANLLGWCKLCLILVESETWPPSSKSLPSSLSASPTTHWPPTSANKQPWLK